MTVALRQVGEVDRLRFRLERVMAERDEALERVRQLEVLTRDLDGARAPEFGLTYTQDLMFQALLRWKMVSRGQMMALLYGDRADPPHDKVLDTLMCKLRKRLRPHGIAIDVIWGRGWALDDASRAKLKGTQ